MWRREPRQRETNTNTHTHTHQMCGGRERETHTQTHTPMEGESGARAAVAGLSLNVTPVEAGQIFSSRQAAKMAAETELAAAGRSIKNGKGGGIRQIHVVCRSRTTWFVKGCAPKTGEFKIIKVGKDHVNCVGGGSTGSNVVQPWWTSLYGPIPRSVVLASKNRIHDFRTIRCTCLPTNRPLGRRSSLQKYLLIDVAIRAAIHALAS